MIFFRFFKDGGRPPLGFVWGIFRPPISKVLKSISINVQNLVTIDAIISIIWKFQYLSRLTWKCLFKPRNWGFGAIWPPLDHYQWIPKKHVFAWVRVVWAIEREICPSMCKWVLKNKIFVIIGPLFTYLPRTLPWTDLHQLLLSSRSRRRHHLRQIYLAIGVSILWGVSRR